MTGAIDEFRKLLASLTDPPLLFGHFTYFLLVLSMLMRRMVWLRSLAVTSGIAKIIYRVAFVPDPVSVFWEVILVLVNVGQLLVIWYYERHHHFAEDERHFAESLPPDIERRAIRKLLRLGDTSMAEIGDTLTWEGQPVDSLIYIADGVVSIEHDGRMVAACGPGDYLGEMSFLTGKVATATAIVVKPARLLVFNKSKLQALIEIDPLVRRAMETGLSRNLAGKLARTNDTYSGTVLSAVLDQSAADVATRIPETTISSARP